MGRPELYTEELGKAVCDALRVSEKGLRGTLADHPELPDMRTVHRWQANNAVFCQMFAQAKQDQLRAMAEDIVDIANDETLDANDKRIRIDTRKWLLSKLVPRVYGDKLDVTSGGEALAVPSHQIDARVQSIIMQAQARRGSVAGEALDLPPNALKLLE